MIISWPGGVTDEGEVAAAACPNCGNHVVMHLIRTTDAWALYFIAVAPYNVNEYISCPVCQHGLPVRPDQRPAIDTMRAHTASYRRGALSKGAYETILERFWAKFGVAPSGEQVLRPAPPSAVPPAPVMSPGAAPTVPSLADQVEALAQLHTDGVLSDDEFAAAKKRVLET
jgi:hypothetical protein